MSALGVVGLLDQDPGPSWETLFWDIFERSLHPIALIDESRRLLNVNSAVLELLECGAGDLVGRSVDELITNPGQTQRDREWEHLLQTGAQSGTHTFRRRDGSQLDIDFATRLVSVGHRPLFVAVVLPLGPLRLARRVVDQARPLSARERQVVAMVALGKRTSLIAQDLVISPATVRAHVRNAMAKLEVHTRAQLVAVAISRGELLQPGQ